VTLFAFASCHGSPGTTTTTVGLAAVWRASNGRDVLVVEADPDGGVLAGRFDGLRADRTLADVVVDVRRSFEIEAVLASARPLWDAIPVVVAPPSAEQTHAALSTGGDKFAAGLASAPDLDVLVDVGRLTARSPAIHLARRALATMLVAYPTFESAAVLAARIAELAAHGCEPSVMLVGERPYPPQELERATRAPVTAVLPNDARAAGLLSGGAGSERALRRSLLWRALVDVASRLATLVPPPIDEPRVPASDRQVSVQSIVADA
jgi:hypothetical protein